MPKRERPDLAETLVRKAEEDAIALRELAGNDRVADAIVGFHAQQAVEKWLKAVLTSRGIEYERTHDLDRLSDLAEEGGERLPLERDEISALTEFAVPFRYDDPVEAEPLDRARALQIVQSIEAWARALLPPKS